MTLNELTLNEFKDVLNYLVNNNKQLEDNGLTPIAIGVEGPAGVGKTASIESYAKEHGMTMCKINLSELEEVGDLTGMPLKECEIIDEETNEKKWIPESHIRDCAYNLTGRIRTGYAPPSWLPIEDNPNGTILFLDDYTRKLKINAIKFALSSRNNYTYSKYKLLYICINKFALK